VAGGGECPWHFVAPVDAAREGHERWFGPGFSQLFGEAEPSARADHDDAQSGSLGGFGRAATDGRGAQVEQRLPVAGAALVDEALGRPR
jgi:hypothetical protein